jgi:hypothetical protein
MCCSASKRKSISVHLCSWGNGRISCNGGIVTANFLCCWRTRLFIFISQLRCDIGGFWIRLKAENILGMRLCYFYKIWGSHGCQDAGVSLLDCDAVKHWRWREHVPPKRWYLPTNLNGVTTENTNVDSCYSYACNRFGLRCYPVQLYVDDRMSCWW